MSGFVAAPPTAERIGDLFGNAEPAKTLAVDDAGVSPKGSEEAGVFGATASNALRQLRRSRAISGPI
jgi:hypothetical protein